MTQVKVLISGGFHGAYNELVPEFERADGVTVTAGSGASQGAGPQTIAAQLARGVAADVVILSREGLTELIAAERIVAGTDVDLARVGVGVAVQAGIAKPDVGTVEGFRQVLLKAKTVAVPGSTSGIWLVNDLFPRLAVADKINVVVRPRGTDVTAMIVEGTADLGVLPTSEIAYAKGVQLAGNLAAEIQFMQTFSAAIVAGSQQADAAGRLIAFLTSPRAFEAIRKGGMEPSNAG